MAIQNFQAGFQANPLARLLVRKYLLMLLTATYSILLVFLYSVQVSRYYAYMGLHWEPNTSRIVLVGLIIFGLTLVQPTDAKTRSVFLILALFMHFIPSLLFFAFSGQDNSHFFTILTGMGLFVGFSFLPVKRIVQPSLSWRHVFWISFFLTATVLAALVAFQGFSNFNLNFSEIYGFRSEARSNLPSIFGYLRPISTKVFLPIFLVLAFASKRRSFQILAVLFVLSFFAFSNHKSIIASSLVTVVLFLTLRKAKSINNVAKLFVALIAVCAFEALYLDWYAGVHIPGPLNSMIVRRTLFIPALLNQYHIDFFQSEPFTYWAQSKLSLGFVERSYDLNTPFLIGEYYFNRETMAANTGFIGAGYSNAGNVGVFLYGALLGVFISYLHEYGNQIGHSFVIGVAFSQIIGALNNSDLPTVMLTNGLGVILVLFVYFPRKAL